MRITILLICCLFTFCLTAQQFEAITTGDISTVPADSRSCNFIDLNGDYYDDIFITNGPSSGQNNRLFISRGDGTFRQVTDDVIVMDSSASDGATFGDVDNDGDLDAYIVTWYGQRNFFYRNRGDVSFDFETETAHPGGTFSETAAWGDWDADGLLDLYISNSTDFKTNTAVIQRNPVYHNRGDGNFQRIDTGKVATDAYVSRSIQWIDFDNDRDLDLWVSNEENQPNFLYVNDGRGALIPDTTLGLNTTVRSSTGSSWGDIDNDGDPDLFVANYAGQKNQLFRNNGDGSFTEIMDSAVSRDGGCSFGSGFADFDNDGDLDLFVASGFCGQQATRNLLYRNDGDGQFTRDTVSIPDDQLVTQCSFGTAWGDYDNDGFLDLIVANCRNDKAQPQPTNTLLHNLGNGNNWIKLHLVGTASNRAAIGAKVRLLASLDGKPVWQLRDISAQSGYCGQSSLYVHFGLRDAATADSLVIEWPNGATNTVGKLSAGQVYRIEEIPGSSHTQAVKVSSHSTPHRQSGPIIEDFGAVWPVPDPDFPTDPTLEYRVVFDVYNSPEDPAELNPSLNTLARFLNMHAQAGVPRERLHVACVIHGPAGKDAMNSEAYKEKYGTDNPNVPLLEALGQAGARIYLCGQSAYSRGLDRNRLARPVQVGLSAITVILNLEAQGYRLIRF